MPDLVSYPSLVETPFVNVEIAGIVFGIYKKSGNRITYPNFITSIDVTKINGELNLYTINLEYQIQAGDDPNFMDAVFSANKAKYGWQKIILTYGDMSCPAHIFKKEEAIATKITSSVDFARSKMTYTLNCTSTKLQLLANSFSFPPQVAKPSDVIFDIIFNKRYGVQEVLTGMVSKSKAKENGWIAADDKEVKIEGKENIDLLSYLNYLSECMSPASDPVDTVKHSAFYQLVIDDDVDGKAGGAFLKVVKVEKTMSNLEANDGPDVYTVDIGYPGSNFVTSFSVDQNQEWSIFYDYSHALGQPDYIRSINDKGEPTSIYSPSITTSRKYKYTTESDKSWWTRMTEFPITAKMEIKGLLRPSVLMGKVRINSYFYGIKHISSGLYVITQQDDKVNESGYKTTLSLTRLSPDVLK